MYAGAVYHGAALRRRRSCVVPRSGNLVHYAAAKHVAMPTKTQPGTTLMPEENSHEHEAELVRKAAEDAEGASDRTATGPSDPLELVRRLHVDKHTHHPLTIGPFKILDVLGEGGMGIVYLAEQDKPVRRRVALKVLAEERD